MTQGKTSKKEATALEQKSLILNEEDYGSMLLSDEETTFIEEDFESAESSEIGCWVRVKKYAKENPVKIVMGGMVAGSTLFGGVTAVGLFSINQWVKSVNPGIALTAEFASIMVGGLLGIFGAGKLLPPDGPDNNMNVVGYTGSLRNFKQ